MDRWSSLSQEHSRPSTSDLTHPLETHTHSASKQFSEESVNGGMGNSSTHSLESGLDSIGHTHDPPAVNGWVDDPPIETLHSGGRSSGGGMNTSVTSSPAGSRKTASSVVSNSHTPSSSVHTNGHTSQSVSTHTPGTSQITAEDYYLSELLEGDGYFDDETAYPKQGHKVVVFLKVGATRSTSSHYEPPVRSSDIRHQDPVIEEVRMCVYMVVIE